MVHVVRWGNRINPKCKKPDKLMKYFDQAYYFNEAVRILFPKDGKFIFTHGITMTSSCDKGECRCKSAFGLAQVTVTVKKGKCLDISAKQVKNECRK